MLLSLALFRQLKAMEHARCESPDPYAMWRRIWTARLDRLEAYLRELQQKRRLAMSLAAAPLADNEVLFTRTLDAPRELVFRMWTEQQHVEHWWRPGGFRVWQCEEMDVRVGGRLRFRMLTDAGVEYMSHSVYREIAPPERLVYEEQCYEAGKLFHKAWMTVTLKDLGGRTELSIHGRLDWVPDRNPQWTEALMKQGWLNGWKDNADLLVKYLQTLATGKGA